MRMAALFCAAVLIVQAASQAAESALEGIEVKLIASRPTYVLGEPVELHVSMRNTSSDPLNLLPIFEEGPEENMRLLWSSNGKDFQRLSTGIYPNVNAWLSPETIKPGDQRRHVLRILYTCKNKSGLALEQPGVYHFKIDYPLYWADTQKGDQPIWKVDWISSATVQVEVLSPVGVDAQVWERIKGPDFAYFLRCGKVKLDTGAWEEARNTLTPLEYANGNWVMKREYAKLIPTALSIFESYAKTTYREPLREALLSFYNRSKSSLSEEQANRMRTVLRIKEGLFPDDKRLERKVHLDFREPVSWEMVIASLSKQAKIKLSVDEQLKHRTRKSLSREVTLREAMSTFIGPDAEWIPDGKGYRLVPKVAEPR